MRRDSGAMARDFEPVTLRQHLTRLLYSSNHRKKTQPRQGISLTGLWSARAASTMCRSQAAQVSVVRLVVFGVADLLILEVEPHCVEPHYRLG